MNPFRYLLTTALVLFAQILFAQSLTWDFGTGNAQALPSLNPYPQLTVSQISCGNNNGSTTLLTTSSSSTGYVGASGLFNAGAAARSGGLLLGASGSAFFEFSLNPAPGSGILLSSFQFGSRSTATGPQTWCLRWSVDGFSSNLVTGALLNTSTWTLQSTNGLALNSPPSTPVTLRIYGYGGSGTVTPGAANWRIDDLSLVLSSTFVVYADNDGDGYGNASNSQTVSGSTIPAGFVANALDCNDNAPAINPAATEVCNSLDDDCDGQSDELLPVYAYFLDADGDAFGLSSSSITSCNGTPPTGYASAPGDCNDANPAMNPMQTETCNLIDDDCDGATDEGPLTLFYRDNDGDNYGDPGTTLLSCFQPSGYVTNDNDCNDNNPGIRPLVPEACNGIDDNCDGLVDGSTLVFTTYYKDADGDGFGILSDDSVSCNQPTGYVAVAGDCNDTNASINPSIAEQCNAIDDDCDGMTDDGLQFITYYEDADDDGYGGGPGITLCQAPGSGFVTIDEDCDDTNDLINPLATEVCDNGVDNDCDGQSDDNDASVTGQGTYYTDSDNDGYGAGASFLACVQPASSSTITGDCNDNNGAINPAAQEICDGGVDNDCDGQSDDNDASVIGQGTYYTDSDNDGYGAGASFLACVQPASSSTVAGDCNDNNGAINPAAQEICDGGVDNDCDGQSDDNDASVTGQGTYYTDSDNDGSGAGASFLACVQPASSSTVAGDCNDNNGAINPAAQEICDGGVDNDCDGQSDDNDASVTGQGTYYTDSDNDGYGAGASFLACVQPASSSTITGDCNDNNGAINPAAQEICDGGVDNDCDGQSDDNDASVIGQGTYYADSDNDGFGSSAVIRACIQPAGTVLNGNDCNDNNAAINPSVTEVCNGADDDCDGQTDEGTVPALGAISGTASACVPLSAGTAIFSISSVPGVSTYTWTPPTGMTISAGQGTTSITITWTSSAVHTGIIGSLSVTGSTACGATVPSTMNISYNISSPVRPLSISGPIKICPGDTAVFSIATVARASAYTWTMPAGMQIVNGQGGRIILATAVSGFVGGNIDVVASNACGNSPVRSKTMSQNLLLAPGTITGPVAGLCGQTGITYSVPVLTGTFGYIWYVPAGATIVSGQGTTSIVVNFPSSGFNQSFVSVQGFNACGNGTLRTLAVSGVPAIPAAVSGPTQVCPNSTNVLYEVPALSGATTYTWTAPAGSTIASGQGTRSVYLNYGPTSGTNLTLTVVASNACGTGSPRNLGGIAVSSAYCSRVASITGTQVKGLSVYPNPATDRIVVSFEADAVQETHVLITDLLGRRVYSKRGDSTGGINRQDVDVSQLQAGTYQLTVISGEAVSVQTIVIE